MTSTESSAPSVALPRRNAQNGSSGNKPPVWALDATAGTVQTPLPSKCSRHQDQRQGICCKELKGDDERQLLNPDVLRDIVIGLSDGLTVPFALTAGLSSLGSSKLVVLGGIAELIAGMISMGVGGFLAAQAERDHYRYLRRVTAARVLRSCAGEMEREVHAVLGPVGVDEKLSRAVADSLLRVEEDVHGVGATRPSGGDLEVAALPMFKDVGLSAFLLRFGEGLEEVPSSRMWISALTIGLGYLVGGLIPLLPYFFIHTVRHALMVSSILTGVVLLVFGAVKARVSGAARKKREYVYGAVTTMLVGGAAAAIAYGVVAALEDHSDLK